MIQLKAKLMWSSILRAIMQSYYLQLFVQFTFIDSVMFHKKELSPLQMVYACVLIILLMVFPIIANNFLKNRKDRLLDEDYIASYGTLFSNLRIPKKLE